MENCIDLALRQLSDARIKCCHQKQQLIDDCIHFFSSNLSQEGTYKTVGYKLFMNEFFHKQPQIVPKSDFYNLANHGTALYAITTDVIEAENLTNCLLCYNDKYHYIIAIETIDKSKNAQAPNIISAYKLARMCAIMIDNDEYDIIGIDYIGVDWSEDKSGDYLTCQNARHVDLFKVTPSELYINWSAGLQIQFHLDCIDQSWKGTNKEWAVAYLRHFVEKAQTRVDAMRGTFIEPFLKYIA